MSTEEVRSGALNPLWFFLIGTIVLIWLLEIVLQWCEQDLTTHQQALNATLNTQGF